MPNPRHLENAPITEALFDIRVKANPTIEVESFSQLIEVLADRLPIVEKQISGSITIDLPPSSPKPGVVKDTGVQGYFFRSDDGTLVAQFRIDGFTLNRLRPYTSWETLRPLTLDLWHMYYNLARPEAVTRLAMRFINHMPLTEEGDLGRYLRAAPTIPQELPQLLSSFLTRVTIHDNANYLSAHIRQALETDPARRKATIIFDIDAFREVSLEPTSSEIGVIFDQLRDFKNRIFFNYLTDEFLMRFE